ncbi:AcrR family transcriptional regulator [Nocardioides thalensis]|uniref:AcrR family transcriptional regulator n=1 Tax=Nocardioides thalensis TaxID=1914755 RepID=A0A853C2D8_9ACTN|nr:AcrR family transcriptional regulator [Nocardioides thalensis]
MSSYHHGNLRAALVETAVELARTQGPAGVALREVARRTGVSHNAAYRHFADRDDLLREVADVGMHELGATMSARIKRVRAKDPRQRAVRRLRAVGTAYVEYALAEPGLFSVSFARASFDRLMGPYELLSGALDECAETGFLTATKREGAELVCWSAVHGFAMLHSSGPLAETPSRARDADLARLLDRIEDALRG